MLNRCSIYTCIYIFCFFLNIFVGIKKIADDYEEETEEAGWEKVKGGVPTVEKPKMFGKDEEVNHALVLKKLLEILAMRGKKKIHRTDQIEILCELLDITESHKLGPAMEIKIIIGIITAFYEYNPNNSSFMKVEMWAKCLHFSNRLVDTLVENPDILLNENVAEESESFVPPHYRIRGCALTLTERMDEEFTKMLQSVDPHSPDYIERLKDEILVCSIIEKLQKYLEHIQKDNYSELCRVYLLRVDHVYYNLIP